MNSQQKQQARILNLMMYMLVVAGGLCIAMALGRLTDPVLPQGWLNQWLGNWSPVIVPATVGGLLAVAALKTQEQVQRLRSTPRIFRSQGLSAGSTRRLGIRSPAHGQRKRTSTPASSPQPRRLDPSAFAALLTAMAVAVGLVFNAWSVAISQQQADLATTQALREEQTQTEQSLKEAIENGLNHEQSHRVHIHAISTLAKIAHQDVATKSDIIRALIDFIRTETIGARSPSCEPDHARRDDIKAALSTWLELFSSTWMTADLEQLCLSGASFMFSNLTTVNLRSADLTKANLYHADLRDMDFRETIFTNADLSGTHLEGARFAEAKLAGTTLSRAEWSETTSWPPILYDTIKSHSTFLGDGRYIIKPDFQLPK